MLTDEEYQKALGLMKSGGIPKEFLQEAGNSIAEYERVRGMAKPVSAADATRAVPASTLQERPAAKAARQRKLEAVEAEHPGLTKAFQMQAPAQAPEIFSGPTEDEADAELMQQRAQFDETLPNLSKRRDLAAPAEFHPPTPTNPATPFDSVWGKLSAVKQAMPDWAGGGTEHYTEPSPEQFKLEMGRVLGPAIEGAAEGTPAYREWADMKWQQALARAQAEGRGIVRDAFRPGAKGLLDTAGDILRPANVQKVAQMARSADIGADEAVTGGTLGTVSRMPGGIEFLARGLTGGPAGLAAMAGEALGARAAGVGPSTDELGMAYKTAQQEKAYEAAGAPISKDVGFALGALSPAAVGNVAADVAIGTKAAGAIGGAAAGAIGGAATSAASDLPGVLLGEEDPKEAAKRAGLAAVYGAPLGLLGGAIGGAARREGQTLRRDTDLGLAEQGGARMRAIRGVEPGPVNRGLAQRARAEGIGRPNEPDVPGMLAHDLAEPFGKRAHAREAELIQKGQPLREFERQFAGETHPLKNTINAILDAKKKLVQSDGTVASVNQPEMAKLDKLLDDIASTYPQAPEYRLEPKNPRRLDQLERSVDVHGELGTPETYQRDVKNINEMSTPTRAITPQAEEAAISSRAPLATAPDFGPYAENLPGVEGGIEAGMAGERIRSLHEARRASPDAFDIPPADAKRLGLQGGAAPDDFVRMLPKPKNPADLKELVGGVRQRHESTSATSKEPFPDYDKIKRAFHQDRDAFQGETDAIKQSDTYQLDNGETVRGYSAANARLADETAQFEDFLSLLGFKGGRPPDMRKSTDFVGMENLAKGVGEGGRSPVIDDAFRKMAAETGMSPTLENLQRYLAMKRLQQDTRFREVFRFGGLPSVGSLSGHAARIRLDPIVQGSIPYLENLGSLGALPGEVEQSRELPGMADEATLDEIRRALQP